MTLSHHLVARRHRIGHVVGIAVIGALAGIQASAQTAAARDSFQDAVKASIRPILQALCDAADEKDRTVCRKVDFRIADRGESSGATPFATLVEGQRIVELPLVYIRELLLLNDSIALTVILPRADFDKTYGRRLAALRRDNNRRIAAGQPPEEMPLPLDVAEADAATRARVEADPRMAATARNLYEAGVAFVVAHELGHHVNGDAGRSREIATCQDLKQLREQELRADAWAAEALLRIGQPPNGGMTTLLGSYYARSSAPASLQPRDHPADEERMLALQQATLKNLDRLTAIMARNGRSREATESQLKASISRLEAASKELEQDDPCSKATHGR